MNNIQMITIFLYIEKYSGEKNKLKELILFCGITIIQISTLILLEKGRQSLWIQR